MKKIIFPFIFSLFPIFCCGQNPPKTGCIQIYSDPDLVKIEIPELKLKTLKDSFLYNISDLQQGNYTVNIKNKLISLKVTVPMIKPDTFLVYANFKESSIIAVTKSDFKAYNEEQLKKKKLTDSLLADTSNTNFIVEDMPLFNGGDPAIEFRKFIAENMRYPLKAAEKGITGRVIVQFVIDENGKLTEPSIFHSAHPLLDEEALRVLMLSPPWIPGKQKGVNVKVYYTFPINFFIN